MLKFEINLDPEAVHDMNNIWKYIARDSERYANETQNAIEDSINRLTGDPNIGLEEPLLKKYKLGHRYIVYSHYKIIYRIHQDQIFVSTIFDTRQKPSKLKKTVKKS